MDITRHIKVKKQRQQYLCLNKQCTVKNVAALCIFKVHLLSMMIQTIFRTQDGKMEKGSV